MKKTKNSLLLCVLVMFASLAGFSFKSLAAEESNDIEYGYHNISTWSYTPPRSNY